MCTQCRLLFCSEYVKCGHGQHDKKLSHKMSNPHLTFVGQHGKSLHLLLLTSVHLFQLLIGHKELISVKDIIIRYNKESSYQSSAFQMSVIHLNYFR